MIPVQEITTTVGREILDVLRRLTARRIAVLAIGWGSLVVLALVGWRLKWYWLAVSTGVPAVFLPFALLSAVLDEATRPRPRPLVERIDRAATALREAAELVDELEGEISERTAAIERVRGDLERYERLVEIKSDEAKAVAESIRVAMREESRRALPARFAIATANLVVGAVLGGVVSAVFFD